MSLNRRHTRYLVGIGIMLVLTLPIGALGGAVIRFGRDQLPPSLAIFLLALLGGAALLAGLPWWRALDEMEREAQLTSWYWGGGFGSALGVMTAAVIGGPYSPLAQGALLMGGSQLTSFVLFWLAWRVKHRPSAS